MRLRSFSRRHERPRSRTPSRVQPPCTVYVCTRLWITMHAHTFSVGITNGTEDSYRSQQESTPGVLYLSADSNLATEKEANFRFFSLFLSSLPFPPLPLHCPPIPSPSLLRGCLFFLFFFLLFVVPLRVPPVPFPATALPSADSSSLCGHVTAL